ncbi:hypothetical protein [Haloechinothrix halophila]|uniref:hypothetical protein n=1 Tax=Haloechinothrix halophila TaxID=1069073 RepID=UPI00040868EF|nr:hypothetical protein [Haloechinothrix halophila]
MGGKKKSKRGKAGSHDAAKAEVRGLIKAGKVKKKCCKSKPRCARCPVRALKKAKADTLDAAA